MTNREKTLASLNQPTYSQATVRTLITQLTTVGEGAPSVLKKGDVYKVQVGAKYRPAVIVRVLPTVVYSIPLTHENGEFSILPVDSRFFGQGYFCNQLLSSTIEYAKSQFLGVFDNMKSVNEALKLIKEQVKKL